MTARKFTKCTQREAEALPDGRHNFGDNIYLCVKGNRKNWQLIYQINHKRRYFALGSFAKIPVRDVKRCAIPFLAMIAEGIDPAEVRTKENGNRQNKGRGTYTFEEKLRDAIAVVKSAKRWRNPKSEMQWWNTLTQYAVPVLGNKIIDDITKQDILSILTPIWDTKTETAKRLRNRLEIVFAYFINEGLYTHPNPAAWKGNLDFYLPSPSKVAVVEHHKSMPHAELKEKIKRLLPPENVTRALILFTILTASRIGESTPARWEEFDFENRVWSVPPERRKDGKKEPHRVPLTEQMIEVVTYMTGGKPLTEGYVFPSFTSEKHISKETPRPYLQEILETEATMHGMRSTFRDWCAEELVPDIVAEKCLMHATGNRVSAAYQRSDLLDARREVMERWNDYLLPRALQEAASEPAENA
jgi:integrase